MKKVLVTSAILALSLAIRMGSAAIPEAEQVAYLEIGQAHASFDISPQIEAAATAVLPQELIGQDDHEPSLMPCSGEITSGFGKRRWGRRIKMHEGIDIATPVGTEVKAPAKGVVTFVGRKSGYGKTVILSHGGHIETLFAHNSKILVKEGETVEKGQVISHSGNTGRSTGPHLHYEVHLNGNPVNPSNFI